MDYYDSVLPRLLLLAVGIMAICYVLYVISKEWKGLILVSILCGFAELLYQPVIKSIFAQSAKDDSGTEVVHRIRYLFICVAGLLGPIIGGLISQLYSYETCLYISLGLFIVADVSIFFMAQIANNDISVASATYTSGDKCHEAMRSKTLSVKPLRKQIPTQDCLNKNSTDRINTISALGGI